MDFTTTVLNTCQDSQKELNSDYKNHACRSKTNFNETEFRGKNNISNSVDIETDHNNSYGSSCADETCNDVKELQYKSHPRECLLYKRAIDLCIHNRTSNAAGKTIFDDAEYFSKHYSYKLLPISFENVDEKIIHTEHNYCHVLFTSGSDDEDCSRTMDYNQIKEKNYRKRKAKFKNKESEEQFGENGNIEQQVNAKFPICKVISGKIEKCNTNSIKMEYSPSMQPLDLSAPLVQEEKTDHYIREYSTSDVHNLSKEEGEKEDSVLFDSDKENQKSNVTLVEVTITRDDGKCNYQPCDIFLRDVARLVPKLIEKDCKEIDILDRTCDDYMNIEKHRLYYIISESTWHLFQNAKERVILTNDKSLGHPFVEQEKSSRPTFLIFDQFSLAKCLADYCKEGGGCFEYTVVDSTKQDKLEISDFKVESNEILSKSNEQCENECTKIAKDVMMAEKSIEITDGKVECASSQNNLLNVLPDIKERDVEIKSNDDNRKDTLDDRKRGTDNFHKKDLTEVPKSSKIYNVEKIQNEKEDELIVEIKQENTEVPKNNKGCETKVSSHQESVNKINNEQNNTDQIENDGKLLSTEFAAKNSLSRANVTRSDGTKIGSRNLRGNKKSLVIERKRELGCKKLEDSKINDKESKKNESKKLRSKEESQTIDHLLPQNSVEQPKKDVEKKKSDKLPKGKAGIKQTIWPAIITRILRGSSAQEESSKTKEKCLTRSEAKNLNEMTSVRTRSKPSSETNSPNVKPVKLVPSQSSNSSDYRTRNERKRKLTNPETVSKTVASKTKTDQKVPKILRKIIKLSETPDSGRRNNKRKRSLSGGSKSNEKVTKKRLEGKRPKTEAVKVTRTVAVETKEKTNRSKGVVRNTRRQAMIAKETTAKSRKNELTSGLKKDKGRLKKMMTKDKRR
ncbi:hypothetical protein RUM43_000832 [Polyplax serrata]|uniref:Uncharacterized protein n=1 Tax=Polyplax serrata TaxID=468196 RepID=A0AAN8SD23_POLSC